MGHGGGEKEIVLLLRGIEPRFLGNPFRGPTILLNEISRFAHQQQKQNIGNIQCSRKQVRSIRVRNSTNRFRNVGFS